MQPRGPRRHPRPGTGRTWACAACAVQPARRLWPIAFLVLLTLIIGGCKSRAGAGENLITLTVGEKEIHVEVADTYEKQQKGLMFRDKLEKDHGMLFVFPEETY